MVNRAVLVMLLVVSLLLAIAGFYDPQNLPL